MLGEKTLKQITPKQLLHRDDELGRRGSNHAVSLESQVNYVRSVYKTSGQKNMSGSVRSNQQSVGLYGILGRNTASGNSNRSPLQSPRPSRLAVWQLVLQLEHSAAYRR